MDGYLSSLATDLGISVVFFCILIVWSLTWKLLALWKSARKGSIFWFILLAVFNTVGILEILYLFVFSVPVMKKKVAKKKSKKRKRK